MGLCEIRRLLCVSVVILTATPVFCTKTELFNFNGVGGGRFVINSYLCSRNY